MRLIASLLAAVALSSAAEFKGVANDEAGFAFMGKFVFPTGKPAGDVTITLTPSLSAQADYKDFKDYEIWLYDDEDTSWPSIYKQKPTCKQARGIAKDATTDADGKTTVWDSYKVKFGNKADDDFARDESNAVVSQSVVGKINQNARPRFWFVVLANCNAETDLFSPVKDVKYEVHFVNSPDIVSKWQLEFGSNQMGLQILYLVFFLLYMPFMAVHYYGVYQLSQKLEYVHPMVKVFAVVVFLQFLVITAKLVHYGSFARNGVGVPAAFVASEGVDLVARSLFVLMLMLMAKGWTISGDELTGRNLVLAVVGGFFVAAALVMFWQYTAEDPAATKPELGLQIFLVLVNCVWLVFSFWFCYTIKGSYTKEDNPVKKALYRNLGLVYFPWFFGLPFTTFLSIALPAWSVYRIVQIVTLILSVTGYAVLSFFLWPSRAEEYFNISTPDVMKAQIDTYEQL